MQGIPTYAVIDIGSNSFRLEIGYFDSGVYRRLDYLKESVRLGAGLSSERHLSADSMQRGLQCLARFAERLHSRPLKAVRVVATQTLREARNADSFVKAGSAILGVSIEVISGLEEARLIYEGVSHFLPTQAEKRLVIDIGGRSTELILGDTGLPQSDQIVHSCSQRLGSVGWSIKHFNDGALSKLSFSKAVVAAESALEDVVGQYLHFDTAYGASGTIGAVGEVLAAKGGPTDRIRAADLAKLCRDVVEAKTIDALEIPELREDRKSVFPGGLAVLMALFNTLKLRELMIAEGALRHGVIFELAGVDSRLSDTRKNSLERLQSIFRVEVSQSSRVGKIASQLYALLERESGHLEPSKKQVASLQNIDRASMVHEIGCAISHADQHKHGAYVLEHAELQGFSQPEQHWLAQLVFGQKGKLRKLEDAIDDEGFRTEMLVLRLALAFCHARVEPEMQGIDLRISGRGKAYELLVPIGWPERYPQTWYLLERESKAWEKTGYRLDILVDHAG